MEIAESAVNGADADLVGGAVAGVCPMLMLMLGSWILLFEL
jgi:hypothetical protein